MKKASAKKSSKAASLKTGKQLKKVAPLMGAPGGTLGKQR